MHHPWPFWPRVGYPKAARTDKAASVAFLPPPPRSNFQPCQTAAGVCQPPRRRATSRGSNSTSARHPAHWWESHHIQKARSSRPNCGRFDLRRSRASCCRSARFSSVRSVRALSDARRAPNRASTKDIAVHGSHAAGSSSSLGTEFWQRTGAGRAVSDRRPLLLEGGASQVGRLRHDEAIADYEGIHAAVGDDEVVAVDCILE